MSKRLRLKFIGPGLQVTSKKFKIAAATIILLPLLKPSYLCLIQSFHLIRLKSQHATISCCRRPSLMLDERFLNPTGNIRCGKSALYLCEISSDRGPEFSAKNTQSFSKHRGYTSPKIDRLLTIIQWSCRKCSQKRKATPKKKHTCK